MTAHRVTKNLRPLVRTMVPKVGLNLGRAFGLAPALAIASAALPALAMPDPTLPPPALRASSPAAAPATPQVPRRLQGVRPGIDAVIDGHLRRVGERWLGHELLRVDTNTAVLRQPDGRLLRLSLWPTAKTSEPS